MFALVSSASAADIYAQPGGLKEAPVVLPVFTWAGFYIGVNGGGAWSSTNKRIDLFEFDPDVNMGFLPVTAIPPLHQPDRSGPFGGVQAGYNWQFGNFVAGFEGDIQAAGISGSNRTITTLTFPEDDVHSVTGTARVSSSLDWFGTIRGRLGYSFNSVLLYATGGFAAGGIRDSVFFAAPLTGTLTHAFDLRDGETATGFTVGGGLEYAFSPAWSVKLEYQFISLSRERLSNFVAENGEDSISRIKTSDFDHDFNTVRLGINYHFHEYEALPLK